MPRKNRFKTGGEEYMILEQYDREPWGILRPDHVVKRRDGFPETGI